MLDDMVEILLALQKYVPRVSTTESVEVPGPPGGPCVIESTKIVKILFGN